MDWCILRKDWKQPWKQEKREAEGSAEKHETGGHDAGGTGRG